MTTPYELLIPTVLDRLGVSTTDLEADLTVIDALIDNLWAHVNAQGSAWPTLTNRTCTITANAAANVYSAYTRVADNLANNFDAVFAANLGMVVSLGVESESAAGYYILRLIYGPIASPTRITEIRWRSTIVGVFAAVQHYPIDSIMIPTGSVVRAALMSSVGGATITVNLGYHLH